VRTILRAILERALPWWDPAERVVRKRETDRVARRSIAARIALEDVPKRYERYEKAVR
jgi:hypothetical protein